MKRLVSILSFVLLLGAVSLPARASSITYQVIVDTSSANGDYGYIDLQFDEGSDIPVLPVTGTIFGFISDAALNPSDTNNGAINAQGALPGTVTVGDTFTSDYFEGLTFGNSIMFDVTLDGPGVSLDGGLTAGSGWTFLLAFYESDASTPLFASGPAAEIDIDATGTVSASALADNTTLEPVPEPAPLWLSAGAGLLAFAFYAFNKAMHRTAFCASIRNSRPPAVHSRTRDPSVVQERRLHDRPGRIRILVAAGEDVMAPRYAQCGQP
jgi:hypothetical protein